MKVERPGLLALVDVEGRTAARFACAGSSGQPLGGVFEWRPSAGWSAEEADRVFRAWIEGKGNQ